MHLFNNPMGRAQIKEYMGSLYIYIIFTAVIYEFHGGHTMNYSIYFDLKFQM